MKKTLKTIGIILLSLIVLISLLGIILFSRPLVPKEYWNKVETGGSIEAAYLKTGAYEVSTFKERVLQGFGSYEVFYPADLENGSKAYPVVIFVNGSGTPVEKYNIILRHMASWGFIAIGTEEKYDWNGFASEMCFRHLDKLNKDSQSVLFGKIDLDNVGIVGHSQGGVGVISALTIQEHKNRYKAAVSLSPTNKVLADNLEWHYDATLIDTPILLLAGAGGGDDWVVTGEQLSEIFADISAPKIKARRKDTIHNEVLYTTDGYVTAWFMWMLQGDGTAGKAFTGADAEIANNPLYQDVEAKFPIE